LGAIALNPAGDYGALKALQGPRKRYEIEAKHSKIAAENLGEGPTISSALKFYS
jgi:hypothetical protein